MSEIDSLIEQIKCELRENPFFSEGDLAALDACLPSSDELENAQIEAIEEIVAENPCAKKSIDAINSELEKNDAKLKAAVKAKYVISRLQELRDLLYPAEYFYKTRSEFFNKIIKDLDNRFTVAGANYNTEFTNILNKYELNSYKFNAVATTTTISAIDQLNKDIKSQIEDYFSKRTFAVTNTDPIKYSYNSDNPTFSISLPGKDGFSIKSSENQKTGKVDSFGNSETKQVEVNVKILPEDSIYETKDKVFQKRTLNLVNISSQRYTDKSATDSLYPFSGHLANFYKKIEDPLTLFTLKEKGLTTDSVKTDKNLTKEKLDGIVKEQRADGREEQFYIENTETYQKFYENLEPKIEERIEAERTKFRKGLIETGKLIKLSNLAKKQVFDLVNNSQLISTPTEKLIVNGKEIKPSEYGQQIRDKIQKSADEISKLVKDIEARIAAIKKANTPNPDDLASALSATGCLPPTEPPCKSLPKAGSDPLGYKSMTIPATMAQPDYTCNCYWKEVTKHLNKLNLLPIPDIMRLPALRYWPVGILIPLPVPIRIPLPQIWKHIITLNLPFGTLVVWYIQCGIVPSPIVMYIGPDGKKIILLGFRALQGQFDPVGYTINESPKQPAPLGVTLSEIGKPTGTSIKTLTFGTILPDSVMEKTAKVIAKAQVITELVTEGRLMPNGFNIPFKLGEKPNFNTGDADLLSQVADGVEDFQLFVENLSRRICRKIDEIGDIDLPNFTLALVDAEQAAKDRAQILSGLPYNFDSAWLNCDPANLSNNIPADVITSANTDAGTQCKEVILSLSLDLDSFLDKLKLGTYKFPKKKGKQIKPQAFLDEIVDNLIEYLSDTNFGKSRNINLNKRFRKAMQDLDLDAEIDAIQASVDLSKNEDLIAFKKTLKKYIDEICDVMSGKNIKVDKTKPAFKRRVNNERKRRIRFNLINGINIKDMVGSTPNKDDKDLLIDMFKQQIAKSNIDPTAITDSELFNIIETSPKINDDYKKSHVKQEQITRDYTKKALKRKGGSFDKLSFDSEADYMDSKMTIKENKVSQFIYDAEVRKRERISEILGQTILGLTKDIQKNLGQITQIVKPKCCPDQLELPQFIDPLVLALVMSFKQLAHTAIDALTTEILGQIFGQVFQLTKDTVKAVVDLVAKNIPDIDLPLNGAAFIKLIINALKPFLPLLRIPLGPLPRTLGVPQLTLNLDSIVKPLLKSAIQILLDKLLSYFPFKVCDLPFTTISSNILNAIIRGIKSALKRAIMELISVILDPLQSIFKLLNLIKSVKGAFTSLFDMTNPFLKIYKMIKEMLERELPTAAFIKSINSLLLLAQLEALKVLDKASKNLPDIAVYLPIAAGSSLGLGPILRSAVHPILNQDDLPTWDRLSLKNPLYVMFLDDLAHKAKASTGSILGQDFLGTPVYIPTP